MYQKETKSHVFNLSYLIRGFPYSYCMDAYLFKTIGMLGYYFAFLRLLNVFFQNHLFRKIILEIASETVHEVYWQTTLVDKELRYKVGIVFVKMICKVMCRLHANHDATRIAPYKTHKSPGPDLKSDTLDRLFIMV